MEKYYLMSIEKGNSDAMTNLGYYYEHIENDLWDKYYYKNVKNKYYLMKKYYLMSHMHEYYIFNIIQIYYNYKLYNYNFL